MDKKADENMASRRIGRDEEVGVVSVTMDPPSETTEINEESRSDDNKKEVNINNGKNDMSDESKFEVIALDWSEYSEFLDELQTLVKHKRLESNLAQEDNKSFTSLHHSRRTLSLDNDFPTMARNKKRKWSNIRVPLSYTRRSLSLSMSSLIHDNQRNQLSSHQIWSLIYLAFLSFATFASVSIIAPFFPREASQKGMTESVSGMVFAVYGFLLMLMSPVMGKILPHVGIKFVLMAGILVEGVANILFGTLDRINDTTMFTFFAFAVRIIEAIGAAAVSTSSYSYLMKIFPDSIGVAFGLTETCVGLGMSLGPGIGGGLYALGGYGLPFYVLGVVVLVNIPICCSDLSIEKLTYFKLLKIPEIVAICIVIVVSSQSLAFLDPTIEPHLRQFDIPPQYVGLVFLLVSATYAICAPITGYVAGRTEKKLLIMLFGTILTTIGLFLIGPAPFVPFEPGFTLTTTVMALLGIACAIAFIPTFETILVTAIGRGFADDISTHSLVSGLWSSMYALGDVTGPLLGGVLFEAVGFALASTIMGGFALTAALSVAIVWLCSSGGEWRSLAESDSSPGSRDNLISGTFTKNITAMKADSGIAEFDSSPKKYGAKSNTIEACKITPTFDESRSSQEEIEKCLKSHPYTRHFSETSNLLQSRS
ncbi:MFS-type transporter-like protein, partial [Dinothrombium tinctorium]